MNRPLTYVRGYDTGLDQIGQQCSPAREQGDIYLNIRPCETVSQKRCDLC